MSDKIEVQVKHPKLFMRVNGKRQHVEKGTKLMVAKEQLKLNPGRFELPAKEKKIDVDAGKAGKAKGQ